MTSTMNFPSNRNNANVVKQVHGKFGQHATIEQARRCCEVCKIAYMQAQNIENKMLRSANFKIPSKGSAVDRILNG